MFFSYRVFIFLVLIFINGIYQSSYGDNQTAVVSPIYSGENLPFKVRVELESFTLPNGIQSFAFATYQGKWLLLTGRTNGLHGFNDDDNFPPRAQNTTVYVVDPCQNTVLSRSLLDSRAGLSLEQIDLLSVTSAQFYQTKETLYIAGGYGIDSATGQMSTKSVLTAIDIPGLIRWVTKPESEQTAAKSIRHLFHPLFQVTGGYMAQVNKNLSLLIFGQNFIGSYIPSSNGLYTEQVRRFRLFDNGKKLVVHVKNSKPQIPDPNYRRRDLNIVPVICPSHGTSKLDFMAFAGVFTPTGGAWTVPVKIRSNGEASMADPIAPDTFKQAMNHYVCPTVGLYSSSHRKMYVIFFGGISFGFFENGSFTTDSELPFINQITTIQLDRKGHLKQYLMDSTYPTILSTASNPGNPLLFGAGAQFIPAEHLPVYNKDILKLDRLGKGSLLIGYIVGGIQSTLPNTASSSDSAASPYIFRVILE